MFLLPTDTVFVKLPARKVCWVTSAFMALKGLQLVKFSGTVGIGDFPSGLHVYKSELVLCRFQMWWKFVFATCFVYKGNGSF